ncbi:MULTISPECIES: Crp/Fnr family transcriptional regulator [Niastella]|uniref:Crp/Fnr family transcriptional regulator n=1 Tax=Niastella soli TaxID=2821487 RepID=A0ABS3YW00_9BACT|nr:Crp/Fnr family transcriptional regulator [Niastella soli]MBO9202087.1 Crp/Fnr family transcriptional regulator [Niastella soli]
MEELLTMLNSIYPLSEELKNHLIQILQRRLLQEGEYLLKPGRICEHVYFVKKGLLRSYEMDENKKEINTWFMSQGDVVFAIDSFLDQTPSTEFIQALQNTTVYYITFKELENTFRDHITFNFNGRVLTNKYYKLSLQREKMMRIPEATDRFNYLVKHFPNLLNVVQDKHLASFLRISPVTISRLRAQNK